MSTSTTSKCSKRGFHAPDRKNRKPFGCGPKFKSWVTQVLVIVSIQGAQKWVPLFDPFVGSPDLEFDVRTGARSASEVFVHSDHCAKKLLPWFDGMLDADEAEKDIAGWGSGCPIIRVTKGEMLSSPRNQLQTN